MCYGCEQPIYTVGHRSAECPVTLARKAHYADRKKRKSYGSGSVSSQSSRAHQKVKITSRPRIKAPETVTSGEVNELDILDIAMKSSGIQAASAQSTMDLEITVPTKEKPTKNKHFRMIFSRWMFLVDPTGRMKLHPK